MKKRLILNIYGKVQGVFFRASACEWAKAAGLVGMITNRDDGSVGLIAEGDERKLKKLVKWTKQGSEQADVTKIEENWQKYRGEFESFEIKR